MDEISKVLELNSISESDSEEHQVQLRSISTGSESNTTTSVDYALLSKTWEGAAIA